MACSSDHFDARVGYAARYLSHLARGDLIMFTDDSEHG